MEGERGLTGGGGGVRRDYTAAVGMSTAHARKRGQVSDRSRPGEDLMRPAERQTLAPFE